MNAMNAQLTNPEYQLTATNEPDMLDAGSTRDPTMSLSEEVVMPTIDTESEVSTASSSRREKRPDRDAVSGHKSKTDTNTPLEHQLEIKAAPAALGATYSFVANNAEEQVKTLPQIWRHQAEHMLHIVRVACECLRAYRRYLDKVDGRREAFVEAYSQLRAGSGACSALLFTRAAQLIDATKSLVLQEAWPAVVSWLRNQQPLNDARGELFIFVSGEAILLKQHFRKDPGEDETLTRGLVWDCLDAANKRWSGELQYVEEQLMKLLPDLPSPQLPRVEALLQGHRALATEPVVSPRAEPNRLKSDDVGEFQDANVCAGPVLTPAVKVRTMSPRHYQLPTRSSAAKVKAKSKGP